MISKVLFALPRCLRESRRFAPSNALTRLEPLLVPGLLHQRGAKFQIAPSRLSDARHGVILLQAVIVNLVPV